MNKLDLQQLDSTWDHLYIENGTWSKCCRCGKMVRYYHRVQTLTYCDDCVEGSKATEIKLFCGGGVRTDEKYTMRAKILPGYIQVNSATTLPDGVCVLEVSCNNHQEYMGLPKAVEYNSVLFGKTGWNSDSYIAYYRDDAELVRGV